MSKIEKFTDYVIPPGETILELLEANGMTQLDLSKKTEINIKTINEIIKGKAPLDISTALKLETVFGIEASFWVNLEALYREDLARLKEYETLVQKEKRLKN